MIMKYDEDFPMRVGIYANAGDNDGEIAAKLGISAATFYNYKKQFPEFAESLASGRALPEMRLEDSLLDLAMGNCFVTTIVNYPDGREVKTVRQRPPDVKAMIHWLEKNKQYGDDYALPEPVSIAEPELLPEPVCPPAPDEELKAKALAEYHLLHDYHTNSEFSKKDTAKFDSLISITLAEVEKRKQQAAGVQPKTNPANAAEEVPPGLPTMYALPQDFSKMSKKERRRVMSNPKASMEKIEWEPQVIEAWKALAEDFERL
jgi:hypothetical protein